MGYDRMLLLGGSKRLLPAGVFKNLQPYSFQGDERIATSNLCKPLQGLQAAGDGPCCASMPLGTRPSGRDDSIGLRATEGDPGICKSRQGTCHALLVDAEGPLRPCRLRPS